MQYEKQLNCDRSCQVAKGTIETRVTSTVPVPADLQMWSIFGLGGNIVQSANCWQLCQTFTQIRTSVLPYPASVFSILISSLADTAVRHCACCITLSNYAAEYETEFIAALCTYCTVHFSAPCLSYTQPLYNTDFRLLVHSDQFVCHRCYP